MRAHKLTAKYQTTIPREIRDVLNLHKGDSVSFDYINTIAVLRKAGPVDLNYTKALEKTLGEWSSPEDDEACRDL